MNKDRKPWIFPLDSEKLQRGFEILTNWVVLTGPPSSGKTTLHGQLKELLKGSMVTFSHEVSRALLQEKLAQGKSIHEIRKDEWAFQGEILKRKLDIEGNFSPKQVVIFERGIPDGIAHHRLVGLNPDRILDQCHHRKYFLVLLLDPLPFEADGIRIEDEADRRFLHNWLFYDYEALGYKITKVPVMDKRKRIIFVRNILEEHGLLQ